MHKRHFVFIFLITVLVASVAGKDKAHIIWKKNSGPANTWVAFRKEVSLNQKPEKAIVKISVDTKYWLWINGEQVIFEGGLARGAAPNTIYYDEVDFAPYLREGKNSIAVLVWYWGRTRKTHDDSGIGGLYMDADLESIEIKTDASWKMKVHSAYDPKSGGGGKNPNRVNAYNIKYDARKSLGDWTSNAWYTLGYDDSSWETPIEKGEPHENTWGKLVKRCIPQWQDYGLLDFNSLKVNGTIISLPYTNTTDSAIVIRGKMPFNKQITPYFKVNSKAGQTIIADMDNRFNMLKSTYITTKGKQEFEGYSWINGHEVLYTIPTGVEVLDLKYHWTGVGKMTGTFECSDDYFTRLWWMARNTLYVCARDNYMDCPDRERGLWIGDVADQTGAVFYTMDKAGRLLLKKGIDNTIAYRNGDTIQGLAPGFGAYRGKSSELTGQSLQYIDQGIWQYYFNTGDIATLKNAYPAILNYLKLWEMKSNGLPIHRKGYANWVDWGTDTDPTPKNVVLYYMALKATRNMAEVLGKKDDILWCKKRIKSIKNSFEKEYWQGIRYGSKNKPIEERVSSLAVISGLAKEEHYATLVDSVLLPVQKASPHMEWMAEEALMIIGAYNKGLQRMKERHEWQVNKKELTTLYEKYNTKRRGTYNHAWNAPNYVLSRYIAGIKATDIGWSKYEVKPNMAHLTHVKQIVPSVKGDISIEVKKSENNIVLDLNSPGETTASICIPKYNKEIYEILVNGNVVWKKGKLKKNTQNLKYMGNDDAFVKFEVKEGKWRFDAKMK